MKPQEKGKWYVDYRFHISFMIFLIFLLACDVALLSYMNKVLVMDRKHTAILALILVYMELMVCNAILKGEINKRK